MTGIQERIGAVIERHQEAFSRETDRRECSCGNWTEESFDEAGGHLTHAGHVADVLVAELGLRQEWAAESDGGRSYPYDKFIGALRSYETLVHNNTTYQRNRGRIPDFARNPRIVTRHVTQWTATETPTPEMAFTIRCRNRRYCGNAATTITATDEPAAHMAARNQGWLIHTAADQVTCPACLAGKTPPKDRP